MSRRRPARNIDKLVHYVASPPSPPPKAKRTFQPAVWDRIWDRWIQGTAIPLLIGIVAARMAYHGYAVLPGRFRWTVYHGLDARLLALSVLGVALLCHVRGYWPTHRRLAHHTEAAQAVSTGLIVAGFCGMLLHQASVIFR